jgi:HEAT repeat protein
MVAPPVVAPPAPASELPLQKEPRPKAKIESDLPDVAFDIPTETSGQIKAIMVENVQRLFEKKAKASERIKAAQVLGELGAQGMPVRIALCQVMLDKDVTVREAAADALKKIDPKMQFLAVAVLTDESLRERKELLQKIKKLEDDGAPLSPLIAHFTVRCKEVGDDAGLIEHLAVLSTIGKNELTVCRLTATALDHRNAEVRLVALKALPRMKHGKLFVERITRFLSKNSTETPEIRIAAIEALSELADQSTEEILAEAIAGQRYHKDERVRKAVEVGLNKIENRAKERENLRKK